MKYKCTICGYEYDEAREGVAFADLPDSWQCPWCGAPKDAFEPVEESPPAEAAPAPAAEPAAAPPAADPSLQKLSIGQMAALCSNLARGCEKQYMPEEASLFNELAAWFTKHAPKVEDATVYAVAERLKQDIAEYPEVNRTCVREADRGAQRVMVWGEKVTRMLSSLTGRYLKEGDAMLEGKEIWVCSVCGFVYVGASAPDLCPVCKVPSWKFDKINGRKQ